MGVYIVCAFLSGLCIGMLYMAIVASRELKRALHREEDEE